MSNLVYQNFGYDSPDHSRDDLQAQSPVANASDADDFDIGEEQDVDSEIEESEIEFPPHACAYCGLHSPNSVVKCHGCNKWFCNTKSNPSGSHIVTHLVLSRHKVVSLHEESDLGDTTLECYNCGNKNVFLLGYVSAKQESVVVILCRLPCAQSKDINWDVSSWQSLIDDRQFLPWIAAVPSEEELIHTQLISYKQISKLEAQWRLNRDATINDVGGDLDDEEEVLPILMRYNDAFQYQRSFAPLVKLESEFDKSLKESQALEHIQVRWSLGLNNRHLASFTLSTFETNELKVAVGDEIILRYGGLNQDSWEGRGFIVRLPSAYQEDFTLELNPSKVPPPVHLTSGFTAEFVWKGTSYDRMQQAMKTFALKKESVSSYIYHKILGHEVEPVEFDMKLPKKLSHASLTELNSSQTNAVKSVLQRPLSLIQGPPGTGKTVTSATIVYHLSKLHKKRILVCAPSNVAVDHLANKLNLLGLKVVRLTAKSREDVESSVKHLALHNKVYDSAKGELKKLYNMRNSLGELSEDDTKRLIQLSRTAEMRLLSSCDVVCCTCVGAGDRRLTRFKFRTVLIDESTQASEPEVLIPIVKGAKQVILVGDHQQLGPVILEKRAGDAGLKQSLFERLVVLGHVPIRLEVQYRMNPCLSEFPSNMFYEGSLQNGVTTKERLIKNASFPWPVIDHPMMFWANYGREEISGSGHSFLNRVEAMNVEKIITRLFKDGIGPEQIGVITPYEGQRAYLIQYMSINSTLTEMKDRYLEVEITSVDAFQGREKDFIILSCVRANDQQTIGFLSDSRRLNVALTRAKYGLVILGNPRALCRNTLWNHLLVHFREKGCLVDGTLDNLQLSMIQLNTIKTKESSKGLSSQRFPGSNFAKDIDSASVLSYEPDIAPSLDEKQWPSLNQPGDDNVYGDDMRPLNANYFSTLDKTDNFSKPAGSKALEEDIRNITSSFAAGFDFS
ncbi:Piso0_005544 [Millerozyma farinosa CBS 7064]|uniref:Piso0_005544 protein n=1 Tax=Pichia sorbitophila (strain ATCC MYA-4447 / BCRC 22081 / CBS 7064 / NBRC 10061 / NRRL Y-12695) TaxID=559304 RepID=G8Y294_PICSO|nr:Piso0_005544 [Millerozyma farinosa CBS 7064]